MNARIIAFSSLLLAACSRPSAPSRAPHRLGVAPARPATPHMPAIALSGSFSDGTPLTLEALHGRPWVVNLWLPG